MVLQGSLMERIRANKVGILSLYVFTGTIA